MGRTRKPAYKAQVTAAAGASLVSEVDDGKSVAAELVNRVRAMAQAFATGDQVAPSVILWPDPQKQWESVLPVLKDLMPELFVMGAYNPEDRTGPGIWLRCVERRVVDTGLGADATPIFYLPGVSKQRLREVEDCPTELLPLVELQFRGVVWCHPNGKDWTPSAFLGSEHGGLGLDVRRDDATVEALLRALPSVMKESVAHLRNERLDAEAFNNLLAPDLPSEILRWMNGGKAVKERKTKNEWKAFCEQCMSVYRFHPDKDGELEAARHLGNRNGEWAKIWRRFAEAPTRYPVVVSLLEQAAPGSGELLLVRETWPTCNDEEERALGLALAEVKGKSRSAAAEAILDLETKHGARRNWIWRELGRSQLAVAVEHLARLANLTAHSLAAGTADELAERYVAEGWKVDAAAVAALGCCTSPEHEEPITAAVRALYLQWLDESARNLQNLKKQNAASCLPRRAVVESPEDRVIVFADGLRFDVAKSLVGQLEKMQFKTEMDWDWTAFPSVTATCKPHVSPLAGEMTGGESDAEFTVSVAANGKRLTQGRFEEMLREHGIDVLGKGHHGKDGSRAWIEAGSLDKRGHNEGWRLSKLVMAEVKELAGTIDQLIRDGWKEVLVVTDHGWLLMPGGFDKVELPHFLTENRWGRCAVMKKTTSTGLQLIPWRWNDQVSIATPPGTGCFKAGLEYVHGGLSPQEMIVPRILVRAGSGLTSLSSIGEVKWMGLRCRVNVQNPTAGLAADVRERVADGKTSLVEGGQPREITVDGTVSLPMASDESEGKAAVVVLVDAGGKVIGSVSTIIGANK